MRHRSKKITFSRASAPRKALFQNLAAQVILYEKITTTLAKAKAVRPIVEKLITKSKVDNLSNRRRLLSYLPIKGAVKKAFEVLGPRYQERKGGYLRITKISNRHGDGAPMAQIEFV